jgi:hypothetical protein
MDNASGFSPRSFPSIFDDNDNVYGTDALHGDIRPKTVEAQRNAEAPTRTDTPRHRRS